MKKDQSIQQQLPRAVWSLAYKSDVLIIGCAKGAVEVINTYEIIQLGDTSFLFLRLFYILRFSVA